jgi:hypothetical protein
MWIDEWNAGSVSCPLPEGLTLHGSANGLGNSYSPSVNLSGNTFRQPCKGAQCALWRRQTVMVRPPKVEADGTFTAPEMRETGKGCCGLGFKPD